MDAELKGKVAIVTGGARGLGKEIVRGLAAEGANVVICDLLQDAMKATTEEMSKYGVEIMTYQLDVTKLDQAVKMAEAVNNKFGRIDILVNNAGTTHAKNFIESDRHDWEVDIESSLYGTLNCTRAVVTFMAEKKSGRIINMSSNAGRIGFRKEMGYCAAKAGVLGATKAMALEFAKYGIAVNVIAPGFIVTEMTALMLEADKKKYATMHPDAIKERERILDSINPLGRYGRPDDIAHMVVFLSSSKLARYITGQTISIDGGGTMI